MGFPGGSDSKEPATQETWIQSLGGEDPLEEGMAIHASNLAWRVPRREKVAETQLKQLSTHVSK